MFFASTCPVCGRPGRSPCRRCEDRLANPRPLALPPGVDAVSAICDYDDAGRALVHAVKFRNSRATARWAACRMAVSIRPALLDRDPGMWMLTWAPTSSERRRARGFDQAERLARLLGRQVGMRPRMLLRRRRGVHQTGRSAEDRWAGPHFEPSGKQVAPLIVVVDDVVTTGATAAAAARALRASGAEHVWFVAIARTTFKPRLPRAEVVPDAHDPLPGRDDPGVVGSRRAHVESRRGLRGLAPTVTRGVVALEQSSGRAPGPDGDGPRSPPSRWSPER